MIYMKTKERIISKEQAAIISVEESTKCGAPAQNQMDRSNPSTAEYQHPFIIMGALQQCAWFQSLKLHQKSELMELTF
jgi:hypothetical protein